MYLNWAPLFKTPRRELILIVYQLSLQYNWQAGPLFNSIFYYENAGVLQLLQIAY